MRPMRTLLPGLCAAVLLLSCTESPQEVCVRRVETFCSDRGGCTELLRSLEMKSCAAREAVASQSS